MRLSRIARIVAVLLLICQVAWAGVDCNGDADYVDFGAVTGLPTGSNQRSVCSWVQFDAFDTATLDPFMSLTTDTATGKFFAMYAEDNAVSVGMTGHRVITPKSALSTGVWYYVCAVVPSGATTTSNVKIYINGVNQTLSTEAGSSQTLNTGTANVKVCAGGSPTEVFNGKIKDFAIWDTDASANFLNIYNSGLKRIPLQYSPSNLILYAPLNDGTDGSALSTSSGFYKNSLNHSNGTGVDANGNSLNIAEDTLSYP